MKKTTENLANSKTESISHPGKKKHPMLVIILIVLLVFVSAALACFVYSVLTNDDEGKVSSPHRDTVFTLDNRDQILSDLSDKKVSDGLFEISMNMKWHFENASTPSENSYVGNVTTNSNKVYFVVTLDSTGQTVYESPFIPVGYALKNIALQEELSAGTYPCTLTYHLVDEDENEVSELAVAVTLEIAN